MSNQYFQFKQFTVQQENAPMKVTTDACLFGAVVVAELSKKPIKNILDIGTGTGLLSLMLAQETKASIGAIEINIKAYTDARTNFSESPWKKRLNAYRANVLDWQTSNRYDLIISNPPFFENNLQSNDVGRNVAMHDSGLTLDGLLKFVDEHINDEGRFAVLLPFFRSEKFIEAAGVKKLFATRKFDVKQTPVHSPFRSIMILGRKPGKLKQETIIIKEEGNYTPEFSAYLEKYYLNL